MRRLSALAPLALLVAGCGGKMTACPSAQVLMPAGYSTQAAPFVYGLPASPQPYPANATFIYFGVSNVQSPPGDPTAVDTVQGTPTFSGSDGSQVVGGSVQPIEIYHLVSESLFGYASTISGLKPNVTYTVRFASLVGSPSGCGYGAQSAGSFTTTASTGSTGT